MARTPPRRHEQPGPRWPAALSHDAVASLWRREVRRRLFDDPPVTTRVSRYVLREQLGAGSTGLVYRATDTVLSRDVALKLLHPWWSGARGDRVLKGEARIQASIDHPHVLPVFDLGIDRGQVFIAMQLVRGGSGRDLIAARPRWRDVVGVYIAAARGLAAAHGVGLLHRDVRPDNILVADDGEVYVSDFGLSRPGRADTEPSRYASPERGATAAGDQYGLCAALQETLDAAAHVVPGSVRRVVARGLRRDPSERWPTMLALAEALQRAHDGPRHQTAWAVSALVALSLVAVASQRRQTEDACDADPFAPVWNAEHRGELRRVLVDTGHPSAAALAAGIEERIDAYVVRARTAHVETCAALDPAAGVAQRACGESRADGVSAFLHAASGIRPDELHALERVVDALPPVDRCESTWPHPNGSQRPRTRALQRQLSVAATEVDLGRSASGAATARQALAEAEALDDDRRSGEALYVLGTAQERLGEYDAAVEHLAQSFWIAWEHRDDRLAARAGTRTMFILGTRLDQLDAAERWQEHVAPIVARQSTSTEVTGAWAVAVAELLRARGRIGEARVELEGAAAAYRAASDQANLATVLSNLGALAVEQGDLPRAAESLGEASTLRRALDPTHPQVAESLNNLAIVYAQTDRCDEAARAWQEAQRLLDGAGLSDGPLAQRVAGNLAKLGPCPPSDG